MTRRHGSTLVELLVTLVIMAIVASVAVVAIGRPTQAPGEADRVREARMVAIAQRRPTTIEVMRDGAPLFLTALPDGGVVADSALRLDRLTGESSRERP